MTTSPPRPVPTVFSWYMSEIEDLVETTIQDGYYPTKTYKENYSPGLDEYHKPLEHVFRQVALGDVFDKRSTVEFQSYHDYYTNGSSEGIFHLLARHRVGYPNVPLYQFEGEYQGYNEYAKALGMSFHSVPFGQDVSTLPPGVFFVSVPSAIDGNNVKPSVIDKICERHYVVIDCAYSGMSQVTDKLTRTDRVAAVLASMSKPYGLYYYRIGFLWARDPVVSLYGNKWFKNIWSITVGENVLGEYKATDLAELYRPWQAKACDEASDTLGVRVEPSDVWLLGHIYPGANSSFPTTISEFKRGPVYRFCLTPYYMSYEEARRTQTDS